MFFIVENMFLIFIIIGYYEIVLALSLFLSRAVVVMLNITPFFQFSRDAKVKTEIEKATKVLLGR